MIHFVQLPVYIALVLHGNEWFSSIGPDKPDWFFSANAWNRQLAQVWVLAKRLRYNEYSPWNKETAVLYLVSKWATNRGSSPAILGPTLLVSFHPAVHCYSRRLRVPWTPKTTNTRVVVFIWAKHRPGLKSRSRVSVNSDQHFVPMSSLLSLSKNRTAVSVVTYLLFQTLNCCSLFWTADIGSSVDYCLRMHAAVLLGFFCLHNFLVVDHKTMQFLNHTRSKRTKAYWSVYLSFVH